ncbi:MAG: AAA family ATPase [Solirubrobacteraceae bacterium]
MARSPAPTNPFVYARALAPEEGIERVTDVAKLLELASGGHNSTLYAPRRMGKTSLLKQTLAAARRQDMLGVLVDFSDVLSEPDVAARLDQAFRALPKRARRVIDRELGSIGVSTPLGGVVLGRRVQQPDAISIIHALLELPTKLVEQTEQRALVVFDEFQALIALKGLDGVFRSHLQHHAQVSYIFSGSEPSLLQALFEDRSRPFYGQARPIRLQRLDFDQAYDFIVRRFLETSKDAGDAAAELVRLGGGHPQRLMLLAHYLWEQLPAMQPATLADLRLAYDTAMRSVEPELRFLADSLSPNERRVLTALASGLSPFEAQARAITGLASSSSAQRSVRSLEQRTVLERDELGGLQFTDPLFARWFRRHGGARAQIHVLPDPDGSYRVTDGPSLVCTRAEGLTLEEAESEADRVAAAAPGADVMIIDSDDPNDLPDWAVGHRLPAK